MTSVVASMDTSDFVTGDNHESDPMVEEVGCDNSDDLLSSEKGQELFRAEIGAIRDTHRPGRHC